MQNTSYFHPFLFYALTIIIKVYHDLHLEKTWQHLSSPALISKFNSPGCK